MAAGRKLWKMWFVTIDLTHQAVGVIIVVVKCE